MGLREAYVRAGRPAPADQQTMLARLEQVLKATAEAIRALEPAAAETGEVSARPRLTLGQARQLAGRLREAAGPGDVAALEGLADQLEAEAV